MTNPAQDQLDQLAHELEAFAELLRKPGATAMALAKEWEDTVKAASTDPGHSSDINDLAARITRHRDHAAGVHQVMLDGIGTIRRTLPGLTKAFEFARRAERTKRETTNSLERINTRRGHCELCWEAGDTESWKRGRLEHIVLETRITTPDGIDVHDSIECCRPCAKSGHGSRANARSKGETWDADAWRAERIENLRRLRTAEPDGILA